MLEMEHGSSLSKTSNIPNYNSKYYNQPNNYVWIQNNEKY